MIAKNRIGNGASPGRRSGKRIGCRKFPYIMDIRRRTIMNVTALFFRRYALAALGIISTNGTSFSNSGNVGMRFMRTSILIGCILLGFGTSSAQLDSVHISPVEGILHFLDCIVGDSRQETIIIRNGYTVDRTISVAWHSGTPGPHFSADLASATEVLLEPSGGDDTLSIPIVFAPQSIGAHTDTLVITSGPYVKYYVMEGKAVGRLRAFTVMHGTWNAGTVDVGTSSTSYGWIVGTSDQDVTVSFHNVNRNFLRIGTSDTVVIKPGLNEIPYTFTPQAPGYALNVISATDGVDGMDVLFIGKGRPIPEPGKIGFTPDTLQIVSRSVDSVGTETIMFQSDVGEISIMDIFMSGPDAGYFSISREPPPIVVPPFSTYRIDVRHDPKGTAAQHTIRLWVTALINGQEQNFPSTIIGRVEPSLPPLPDTTVIGVPDRLTIVSPAVDSIRDGIATFTVTSGPDIVVVSAIITGPDSAHFRTLSLPAFPLVMSERSSLNIGIAYDPRSASNARHATLVIKAVNGSAPKEYRIPLQGLVDSTLLPHPNLRFATETGHGNIGSTVRMDVVLGFDLPDSIRTCQLTIHHNASVIIPLTSYITDSIADGRRWTRHRFAPSGRRTGSILVSNDYMLTLGDASSTRIIIDNIRWYSATGMPVDIATSGSEATISVDDAEGRLVNANDSGLMLSIRPAPVEDGASFTYDLTNKRATSLVVYDNTGHVVMDLTPDILTSPSSGSLAVETGALAGGTYFVRLSAGRSTIVVPMIVR
ncbi:MAG: hypothetical protein BGO89_13330 [Candidatus Kapaibacterium thiocyanatum]|uniref:Secretion system C-terminal sorting domain-containing protein n=1 Tax=Candidatus Kapaibacterium thiocyanatum TaxID=1895771 RepID=A0A1M3KV77_9BACT|nr:MAG: hypothetical protein BGO89_13330 ['Candidatus Kapabacteria' thiocyanatum]